MTTSKTQSNITIAIIGPFGQLPGLTYDGFEIVGGLDKLNITTLSDLNLWGYKSWWYWNQFAVQVGIDQMNRDPTILPNTTILIKRFNNFPKDKRQRSSAGTAIALAYEIANHHPEVIGVVGDFDPLGMVADAEVYSYYKIPQCTGSTYEQSLWNRKNYPYYFQTLTLTGTAESIALTLNLWNVNRVALIDTVTFADNTFCGYISRELSKLGFHILGNIVATPKSVDYLAQTLAHVDARYIIMCGSQDDTASIYFDLATTNRSVGNDYVWFTMNSPFSSQNATALWGADYFKYARGIMNVFGTNAFTPFMYQLEGNLLQEINNFQAPWGINFSRIEIESYFDINQMYDCPRIMASGFDKLLKSNPSFSPQMLGSRKLQDYLNYTLYIDTGYRGIMGDPVIISSNGEVATQFVVSYTDGLSDSFNQIPWAITNMLVTNITIFPNATPIFFDGSANPPLDGPIYTSLVIDRISANGILLTVFTALGLIASIGFLIILVALRGKKALRSGSILFLSIMTLGTVPSYTANMTYIGLPSVSTCQARMWLQLTAFVIVTGASLVKNARVCLIYSSAVRLPPYFVRDALWFTVVTILLAIELFLLGLWHALSNPTVIKKQLPGYVYQYTCEYTSPRGSALGTTLWVYNILLLAFIPLVTYFARNLGPTHSEFTFLLVLSLSATVSAILLVILHQPDDLIRSEMNEATLIFINTSIPLLMQSTPRIWDLFLTRDKFPVPTTSATSSQNQTKSKRGSMMQPLLGSFHRTSFMKGRDSVSIVRTSMTAGVVKETPKFSILYDVVYLLNMVRSTSVWTKGVVAVGYMRGKVYLLFIPYKTNLMGASTAVTIHASTDSTPESRIKVIKGRNGQQDRLEVTTKQGPVVIDFEKAGSGEEVKQIIIGFIKK